MIRQQSCFSVYDTPIWMEMRLEFCGRVTAREGERTRGF